MGVINKVDKVSKIPQSRGVADGVGNLCLVQKIIDLFSFNVGTVVLALLKSYIFFFSLFLHIAGHSLSSLFNIRQTLLIHLRYK